MRQTQEKWVIEQLLASREVTRNQCLRNYISRLSAIIQDLEEAGWQFTAHRRDGDFVYKLVMAPDRVITVYDLIDGVRRPRRVTVPYNGIPKDV